MNIRPCPLCGGSSANVMAMMSARQIVESSPYYDDTFYTRLQVSSDDTYPLVSCRSCNFYYSGQAPDEVFLARLYEDADDSGIESRLEVFARPARMAQQIGTYSAILRILATRVTADARGVIGRKLRLLDFGCGVGAGILSLCRPGFPYQAFATDYSSSTRSYLASQGLRAARDLDELEDAVDLDALVLSDVLEHLVDPVGEILQLTARLADHGVLWISVPNFIDWRMRAAIAQVRSGGLVTGDMNPWEHLSYFTPRSLDAVMERAGFVRVRSTQVEFPVDMGGSIRQRLIGSLRLLRDFLRAQLGKTPSSYSTSAAYVRALNVQT